MWLTLLLAGARSRGPGLQTQRDERALRPLAISDGAFMENVKRGELALDAGACTSCMICVRECPNWCITLDAHQEEQDQGGRRPIKVNVLDRFEVDYGLCMFCGICVDACPHDALFWAPDAENVLKEGASGNGARQNLVYQIGRLEEALPRANRSEKKEQS